MAYNPQVSMAQSASEASKASPMLTLQRGRSPPVSVRFVALTWGYRYNPDDKPSLAAVL
jgi:hypothetical protein